MSFSSDAKAELCMLRTDKKCCAVAEAYGILLYCNTFSPEEIRIITASAELAARLPKLFRRAFAVTFDKLPAENTVGKRTFIINDRGKIARIFSVFGADADATLSHHINFGVLEEDCCRASFIRGAFLAGGSVNDPEKGFHLELSTSHRSVSREACAVLMEMELFPKEAQRGAHSLLYFKQADTIADFFTRIGASSPALDIINAKVEREMRNTVTRRVNCDTANVDKTVAAAEKQLDAIRRVIKTRGLDSLPEELRDTAILRLANPEASLADLARLSMPPMTKSSLMYRLKKIMSLAEGLDTNEGEETET